MAIHVKRRGMNGNSTMRRRHPSDTLGFWSPAFDDLPCSFGSTRISWGVARRQSIWLATDVCNQRMHDERRWLVEAVWLVYCRRRVILTVTRDSSALDLHLDQARAVLHSGRDNS